MSLPVTYADEARTDFLETLEYLSKRNRTAAETFRVRVDQALETLAAGGIDGREVTLTTGEKARRWVIRPSWILYYERTDAALHVLRIYHVSRSPIEVSGD